MYCWIGRIPQLYLAVAGSRLGMTSNRGLKYVLLEVFFLIIIDRTILCTIESSFIVPGIQLNIVKLTAFFTRILTTDIVSDEPWR